MKIYATKTKYISKQASIYHHKINYLTLARLSYHISAYKFDNG